MDYEAVKAADQAHIRDFHVQKVTEKEYWDSFCKLLGKNIDHRALSKLTLTLFKPKKPVIELIKRLRRKYKIALLSNHTVWLELHPLQEREAAEEGAGDVRCEDLTRDEKLGGFNFLLPHLFYALFHGIHTLHLLIFNDPLYP